jgi:hypothetical protein
MGKRKIMTACPTSNKRKMVKCKAITRMRIAMRTNNHFIRSRINTDKICSTFINLMKSTI